MITGKPFPSYKLRPFIEFRRQEIALAVVVGMQHDGERWLPDVWIHVGPIIAGIEIRYEGGRL